jgi:hypothetical protein
LKRLPVFEERLAEYETDLPGYAAAWSGLEATLLASGGSAAVVGLEPDEYLVDLLERGRFFDAERAEVALHEQSECHANSGRLWLEGKGFATGYALSEDGLWRQHSWGVASDDAPIETTETRTAYYGIVLDNAAALRLTMRALGGEEFFDVLRGMDEKRSAEFQRKLKTTA